jgi:hypothetical protein
MKKVHNALTLASIGLAGFVGGLTSNALFTTQQLHAQGGNPNPKVTIAQPVTTIRPPVNFQQADGRIVARLYTDSDGAAHFEICNNQGAAIVKLNSGPGGKVATYDGQGHLKSELRSDASSFISYNGAGQAGVTIGSGNIPGSGYLTVNRFGNSQHEISVVEGSQGRVIWSSP